MSLKPKIADAVLEVGPGRSLSLDGTEVAYVRREGTALHPSDHDDFVRELARRWNEHEKLKAVLHDCMEDRGIDRMVKDARERERQLVIDRLYNEVDAYHADDLDHLMVSAGLLWTCPRCHLQTPEHTLDCDSCGAEKP